MKKWIAIVVTLVCIFTVIGCGKQDTYEIRFTAPASLTEDGMYQPQMVYSDEEISPTGNKIIVHSNQDLGDSAVVLQLIEGKEEKSYEPTYITPGMPVEIEVEKGAWYKVGVFMQNSTDTDRTVYVEIEGVEVRIE